MKMLISASLMNSHFERTMLTSKFFADFARQTPLKVQTTQPDRSQYQFLAHFALKKLCTAKSTQAVDANQHLSKYTACETLFFGEILHFQLQMCGKRWDLIPDLLTGPLIKTVFEGPRTILTERAFKKCIAT